MRPAFLSNNDYNNHYSASIYAAVPKSSTYYSRPIGFTFKNDSPKSSNYSSRYNGFAYKTEKITDTSFERRGTPTRDYSAPRTPTYQLGFYESDKSTNDQRTYFEPYQTSQNVVQYTPSRNFSASPLSRSTFLKEEDSPILTRRRFEDFDLDLDSNSNSFLKDSRPSSAKNNNKFEDTSARRPQTSYNHIEDFISRYKSSGGIQMTKTRVENNDPSPRGYGLTRSNNANSSAQLMTSTLRSSLYADSNNSQSVANIKKPNNFFDIQNNNNETSRLKNYNNPPAFEYKKYDQKDASELISSLNKPLLTRSEMNLLKTFDRNANENKSPLYASRVLTRNEQEEVQQPRQGGEKSNLDSYITRVDRGASFLNSPKGDNWFESKSKPDLRDSSFYESEASTAMTKPSQSPFKLSQGLLDRESKFFKDTERQKEIAKWNERSTRANSSMRHDESLESSPEDERRKASSYTYYMTDMKKNLRSYGGDYFSQIYKEHFQQTFQALKLCKYMKNTDFRTLASKKVHLPRKDIHKNRKTLIFDLDETLIHCVDAPHKRSDVQLSIKFPDGERMEAGINVRPYAIECLRELNQYYEVMVFTASHKCYANAVLDYLDPHKQYIHHRLYRDSCVYTDEGVYVKDLRVLANRDLHDVILVDNAAYSYGLQIENGVPIIPFYENKADQELKHLTTYLKQLCKENNLREVNKRTFKLHLYSQYNTPEEVKNRVFV